MSESDQSDIEMTIPKIRSNRIPVRRIESYLERSNLDENFSENSSNYLAATIEYLLEEVLLLSGKIARDDRKMIIVTTHIHQAAFAHEEWDTLVDTLVKKKEHVLLQKKTEEKP